MYERYIQEYKAHSSLYGPKTAIFLLVGSFYELYDLPDPATGDTKTSMRAAVEILGIALKVKRQDGPKGADGLFAGFPQGSLHDYAAKLTRENWTVVVIDQVKDSKGAVKSREVTRILSPGTHVEAAQASGDAVYLAGVWLEPAPWTEAGVAARPAAPSFAAAALDLSTGAVHTFEGQAAGRRDLWTSDDLLHFFAVHPPRELLIWWRGALLDQPTEQTIRRTLGVSTALLHLRQATPTQQGALEKPIVREDLLRRCFQPRSVLPLREVLGLTGHAATERVLTALLTFVEDHYPSAMDRLHCSGNWSPGKAVTLGNHALSQLNMITSRDEDSVLALFQKTLTPMGRRALRQRLLAPLCDRAELSRRYEEIAAWLAAATDQKEKWGTTLRQMGDLSRLHRQITTASITHTGVQTLDQSYTCIQRLQTWLESTPSSFPADLVSTWTSYLTAFHEIFDVEKARTAGDDVSCLRGAAAPATAGVEAKLAAAKATINTIHQELADWLQEEKLSIRLELKESLAQFVAAKGLIGRAQARLRAGAQPPPTLTGLQIHSKKSGGGAFEIPALTTQFHAITRLREQLTEAVREEMPQLTERLATSFSGAWEAVEDWVARVDMSCTLGRIAAERGYCRPELVDGAGGSIEVCGLRHPLIELQQSKLEYVQHDVALGTVASPDGWLVYGMNASGKSSLMKAVGLAVLLAQCGSYVPATSCRISPFRAIYTRILNTDNLWAGLSSFAVEMTELREVLTRADPWSLVLGDEVCSGTESVSATALVAASLSQLSGAGARYIFATHLHDLQRVDRVACLPRMKTWHLRVRYDGANDRLVYDRTLHPGPGKSLYGLEVAKAMAIPTDVLNVAQEIRRELLGTATEEGAPDSSWNAAVHRRACELCNSDIVRDLEVHHIRPRCEAGEGGILSNGTQMNALRNLIVVCQKCHDEHHSGRLEIGPLKVTSEGPVREVVRLEEYAYRPSAPPKGGLTEEQLATVQGYLRKYPNCTPKRMLFDLEEKEGIRLTAQRLRTIRTEMPA